MASAPNEIEKRRRWFERYVINLEKESVVAPRGKGERYRCPCCHYKTLEERGGYEICPVCGWEDDGQDDGDADTIRGGPNGMLSLTLARKNYIEFGAASENWLEHSRQPKLDEE